MEVCGEHGNEYFEIYKRWGILLRSELLLAFQFIYLFIVYFQCVDCSIGATLQIRVTPWRYVGCLMWCR